ncbi:MAG: DUF2239 family protein [Desulfomicrobium escambiense]|nr:DUF2239 family protein [Desulfomicrobium escambiense]
MSLLPRHWDWLKRQRNNASATLRQPSGRRHPERAGLGPGQAGGGEPRTGEMWAPGPATCRVARRRPGPCTPGISRGSGDLIRGWPRGCRRHPTCRSSRGGRSKPGTIRLVVPAD